MNYEVTVVLKFPSGNKMTAKRVIEATSNKEAETKAQAEMNILEYPFSGSAKDYLAKTKRTILVKQL